MEYYLTVGGAAVESCLPVNALTKPYYPRRREMGCVIGNLCDNNVSFTTLSDVLRRRRIKYARKLNIMCFRCD